MRRPVAVPILAILAVLISACSLSQVGGGPASPGSNGGVSARRDLKGRVGQALETNGIKVTVLAVQRDFRANDVDAQPGPGHRYDAVQVQYENTGNDAFDYGEDDWTMRDSQGREQTPAAATKDPPLQTGTLEPHGKVQGWLVFDPFQDATGLTLFGSLSPNGSFSFEL
jgi:hypothetical protein